MCACITNFAQFVFPLDFVLFLFGCWCSLYNTLGGHRPLQFTNTQQISVTMFLSLHLWPLNLPLWMGKPASHPSVLNALFSLLCTPLSAGTFYRSAWMICFTTSVKIFWTLLRWTSKVQTILLHKGLWWMFTKFDWKKCFFLRYCCFDYWNGFCLFFCSNFPCDFGTY